MRRALLVALLWLLTPAFAIAEDPKPPSPVPPAAPATPAPAAKPAAPLTAEQAADAVASAVKAKDEGALRALAAKDVPDPWIVADELVSRGERDVAAAFAAAQTGKDAARLAASVPLRPERLGDADSRRALAAADAALAKKEYESVVAALAAARPDPDTVLGVRVAYGRAVAMGALGQHEESERVFVAAAESAERLGWLSRASAAWQASGRSAYTRGAFRTAAERATRQLADAQLREHRRDIVVSTLLLADALSAAGDPVSARPHVERAILLAHELQDPGLESTALLVAGNALRAARDLDGALRMYQRGLALSEERNLAWSIAAFHINVGLVLNDLASPVAAADHLQNGVERMEGLKNWTSVAAGLGNLGATYIELGEHPKAIACYERALALHRTSGDRFGVVECLNGVGRALFYEGRLAAAIRRYENALDVLREMPNLSQEANVSLNLAWVHEALEADEVAIVHARHARELFEKIGDVAGALNVRLILADVVARSSAPEAAVPEYESVIAACEQAGASALMPLRSALSQFAGLRSKLGDYEAAARLETRSMELDQRAGNRAGVAASRFALALYREEAGDFRGAIPMAVEASAEADELALAPIVGASEAIIAKSRLALGEPVAALKAAGRALESVSLVAAGLDDEEATTLRQAFTKLCEAGVQAGRRTGSLAEVSRFLESGRAGALLESLGWRRALEATVVPEPLRRLEAEARVRASHAAAAFERARQGGARQEIEALRAERDDARAGVAAAIARIQREAKAAAAVVYPQAESLESISAGLREGEVLVSYGIFREDALALVVTRRQARIVPLATSVEIAAACAACDCSRPDAACTVGVDSLRRLVVDPLGLDERATRILVSPDGPLCLAPFAWLLPGVEVVMVPSGSTLLLLRGDAEAPGQGVLALGDPDLSGGSDPRAANPLLRGRRLAPLPGARQEARAVGDVVLLGKDATIAGFVSTLRGRPRWRAVHFACHAMVDAEQPRLSSLALAPSGEEDGLLSALDVFRMSIPADLVVLSACQTGKGKIVRGEGIVGLTRAFMFTGAPRILVSLWKVDDEATSALMEKFYSLWNPRGGSKPMGAAAALRAAQDYVKSQEKWKHPYYWAAWVLWGLPE